MSEITLIIDDLRGAMVVEDNQDLSVEAVGYFQENLGEARSIACARPLEIIAPPINFSEKLSHEKYVRIAGYYHNSLTEGPGRRSSVLFQFCPLKCQGCYVPQLHDKESGELISVKKLAELLLDPKFERDGITILGGEPFAQPDELLALVKELRKNDCPHIVCYSGYTLKILREKAVKQLSIGAVLDEIDILIDGAYVESLASSAGLWTGSGNQRVIDLITTRAKGKIAIYE
jgi:anaerobic ribonucleoside-triphosphate reductase activating protein